MPKQKSARRKQPAPPKQPTRPVRQTQPAQKQNNKPVYHIFKDYKRYRITFATIFSVLLIFAGGLGTALSYAYIHDIQTQISALRKTLQTQQDDNAALRAEITQQYAADEVERIATERLGMRKPDPSQIIRINVPKQSYIVFNDQDEGEQARTGFSWEDIQNFFENLFKE